VTNGAKLRVGVVGLGRAGRIHLDAWRAVPGVRVVAVCDPAPAVVHAARAEGLHAVADPSELFATVPLDAVSIAAPPAQHKGGVYDKHASHVAMMRAFLDVLSGTGARRSRPANACAPVVAARRRTIRCAQGPGCPSTPWGCARRRHP
jgi:3-hydroxyisobutyrate dehydrogenase-like beta-hydroxyacid dehydrogenase